jgi:hypothetical protein
MSRRRKQNREAKELSGKLHSNLSLYALAASAAGVSVLALAQPAEAQIVYTPANSQISFGQKIHIDLNHDGITDLTIQEVFNNSHFPGHELQVIPSPGGGIKEGDDPFFVAAMEPGSAVGPSAAFVHAPTMMASATIYGSYIFGSWVGVQNRFLGIQFQINGEVHYGWARLNTTYFRKGDINALLTGYAYETQANTPILAGDRGENSDDPAPKSQSAVPAQPVAKGQSALGALALGSPGIAQWRNGNPLW